MSTKSLILGGVKSGKSRHAENMAAQQSLPVRVIVTATPDDAAMSERIKRHQQQRNPNWLVEESPIRLGDAISAAPQNCCLIVDCLTLWLTNLLMSEDELLFSEQRSRFLDAVEACQNPLIVVSNETNMGIVPMGELTRRYCDEIGLLHQRMGELSDEVVLMVAGLPHAVKSCVTTTP